MSAKNLCARAHALRPDADGKIVEEELEVYSLRRLNWGMFLIWFLFIALLIWIFLSIANFVALQQRDAAGNPTGQPDAGKIFAIALIAALIVVAIVYFVKQR